MPIFRTWDARFPKKAAGMSKPALGRAIAMLTALNRLAHCLSAA
jgi:hypothetical protein